MKSKLIYLLLITLLVTNVVMLFMLINKPHKRHMGNPKDFLIKKLNLDKEQRVLFLELDKEHKSKMMFYDDEIIKLKKNMFLSFSGSKEVDNSITSKIGALIAKKENEIFSFFRKIKGICNEKQIVLLEEIIERAIMHPGGMPPPPRERMPPPPR